MGCLEYIPAWKQFTRYIGVVVSYATIALAESQVGSIDSYRRRCEPVSVEATTLMVYCEAAPTDCRWDRMGGLDTVGAL